MPELRLATCLPRIGIVATLLCAACRPAQPPGQQRGEDRVLLVPRSWDDTSARQLARSVLAVALRTESSLSLVPLKEFENTLMLAVPYPAEWEHTDLRETCKLVHAGRYVAVTLSRGVADSLRFVISGAKCAIPVDSFTFVRTLPPHSALLALIARLDRQPR